MVKRKLTRKIMKGGDTIDDVNKVILGMNTNAIETKTEDLGISYLGYFYKYRRVSAEIELNKRCNNQLCFLLRYSSRPEVSPGNIGGLIISAKISSKILHIPILVTGKTQKEILQRIHDQLSISLVTLRGTPRSPHGAHPVRRVPSQPRSLTKVIKRRASRASRTPPVPSRALKPKTLTKVVRRSSTRRVPPVPSRALKPRTLKLVPTRSDKQTIVFDFDCTLSQEHLYKTTHKHYKFEMWDKKANTANFTLKKGETHQDRLAKRGFAEWIMGGKRRRKYLNDYFELLRGCGVTLEISTWSEGDRVRQVLKATGLLKYFDRIHSKYGRAVVYWVPNQHGDIGRDADVAVAADERTKQQWLNKMTGKVIFVDDTSDNYTKRSGLTPKWTPFPNKDLKLIKDGTGLTPEHFDWLVSQTCDQTILEAAMEQVKIPTVKPKLSRKKKRRSSGRTLPTPPSNSQQRSSRRSSRRTLPSIPSEQRSSKQRSSRGRVLPTPPRVKTQKNKTNTN